MKTYERKGWFRLELPDHWAVEEDEEPVAFHDPDGPGALHAHAVPLTSRKPGDRIDVFLALRAYLRGAGVRFDEARATRETREGHDVAATEFITTEEEGRTYWRVWFVTNQDVMAYATYNCPEAHKDDERAAVDAVVASLRLTSVRAS